MKIIFCKYGSSFGTRAFAENLRSTVREEINNNEKVVFDFTGVRVVSNSFADELFGKLIKEIGFDVFKDKTTFEGASEEVINVLLKAINDSIK